MAAPPAGRRHSWSRTPPSFAFQVQITSTCLQNQSTFEKWPHVPPRACLHGSGSPSLGPSVPVPRPPHPVCSSVQEVGGGRCCPAGVARRRHSEAQTAQWELALLRCSCPPPTLPLHLRAHRSCQLPVCGEGRGEVTSVVPLASVRLGGQARFCPYQHAKGRGAAGPAGEGLFGQWP